MADVVVSLTAEGQVLAQALLKAFPHFVHAHQPKPFQAQVREHFQQGDRLVLITAMGIAVRTLAPVLQDKYTDPAVLVLDEYARFVVPLLGGHEAGAEAWGREVAEALGAELVQTGHTDYSQPIYVAGMGCIRGASEADCRALLEACLQREGFEPSDLKAIASIDLKADEVGLLALAESLGVPFVTFSADELSQWEGNLSQRSEIVFKEVGVYGVAESAALQQASVLGLTEPELILPKQKTDKATCALVRVYG